MSLKLIYLLIVIGILATSCNSDVTDEIKLSNRSEMSFDVSGLSRSSVTTTVNQFVVYGDLKPRSSEISSPIVLFDKINVEYKNGSWRYDGIQYWMPNYEHSFIAVCPGAILKPDNTSRYSDSKLTFEYSIPASGNVDDILIATHRRLYQNNESGSMSDNKIIFTFSHLMALINISPAFEDNSGSKEEYILFRNLKISGVNTEAQIDILPAPILSGSSTYDMEYEITGKGEGNYSIDFTEPIKVVNNGNYVKLFGDNDAIIMLPQTFIADSAAEITLSYTKNEDTSINQINIPLKELKWESGKSYIYKFTIKKSGVIFDSCTINPWNDISGDEITVE